MGTPEQKRRMVNLVSSNLTLRERTIDFAYRKPFDVIAEREKDADGGPSREIALTWRLCEQAQCVLQLFDIIHPDKSGAV